MNTAGRGKVVSSGGSERGAGVVDVRDCERKLVLRLISRINKKIMKDQLEAPSSVGGLLVKEAPKLK